MFMCNLIVVCVFSVVRATQTQLYEVPKPKIEVHPKGFTVAIPDEEGISLFAFHGNINKPMADLEAGQFSKDILRKKNHEWVFNETRTKLKEGDVIYYWLFVIKDGLGYRYDDGQYSVTDIITTTTSASVEKSDGKPASPPSLQADLCCELYENSTRLQKDMFAQIVSLAQIHKILFALVEKNPDLATLLIISGHNSHPHPADVFVNDIIQHKLHLPHIKVESADRGFDNVIAFKMKTLNDKLKVILASDKLRGTPNELIW
ncbi:beta-1,3-glucan-binding protein 2-like [Rhynchophorus ferrugineus]|uniref:beta-1,3-glucan-binding protein 2-like n=1 Tax=Rhynchophorus ferrugineus TaxID=354439 RepID=UPI003FCC4DC7